MPRLLYMVGLLLLLLNLFRLHSLLLLLFL
jgi:hypothetical protein